MSGTVRTSNMCRFQMCTGCPKKNAPVIFSVTTGTNTLRIWKTKTDMESSLSQLFMPYYVFILLPSNRQQSFDKSRHPLSSTHYSEVLRSFITHCDVLDTTVLKA